MNADRLLFVCGALLHGAHPHTLEDTQINQLVETATKIVRAIEARAAKETNAQPV